MTTKPWWKPWRLCRHLQWKDRYGRIWFVNGPKRLWWRNELSISETLTFDPVRHPPRKYGPYTLSETAIHPQHIIDLCPKLARIR